MTHLKFFAAVLFCSWAGIGAVAASVDTATPLPDAVRPHGDRVDRAWKRYRNADLGYCVSYPSRWVKGEAFDGTGLFVETGLKRSSKPTGEINIGPMNVAAPDDARLKRASLTTDQLDQDLQEHLAGLQKFVKAEKLEVVERRNLNLQGFTALYVKNRYYDPLERGDWMEEVVFVERKGELFRLELQCPPDQIKRFEPVFAYLVNTFEPECK